MRRRGRLVEWYVLRKQECRGLKNDGRAEGGGAAEADGKDVLSCLGGVVQQVVMTARWAGRLAETSRNTKRARQGDVGQED